MKKELEKNYNPNEIEPRLYTEWVNKKYFHANVNENKRAYTIVIPPPNITGHLHMGHALDNTLQDILIRMKRMQGYETLWQPGTDHASIATEIKILEKLAKQGITKENMSREEFLEKAWEWKKEYGDTIVSQLKKIGCSCDWDRLRFTMDEGCSKAVFEFFKKLYDDGYIYRDFKIINWCPVCKTTISDAEVDYVEKDGNFYHIKYFIKDTDEYLEVATTRPETLFGDTAVIVNPNDKRYSKYLGKTVILPLVNKEIPILADEHADMEFGTGVVKITPAHDPNDFEVAQRHNLPSVNVMNDDGTMNENALNFVGMDRYECRSALIDELKNRNLLIKIQPHKHNVGTHERCGTDIEPMVKRQWFVRMKELAEPAIKAIEDNSLHFVPKRFDKTYLQWLNNIRDWCISRQLWWGHRIPVYYCNECGEIHVSNTDVEKCKKCGSNNISRDEDTLDTWFSSALWPFSTLGWPENTKEYDYFYPTNTLVTGYDIIFFWVVRMAFAGIYNTGKVPFNTVFIHGLVRDSQGRKMSKSLGNGIDPLEVIAKYGADALRYSLVTGSAPGADMRYYDSKVEAARNFANKIWNASRFILMHMDKFDKDKNDVKLMIEDKWILSGINDLVVEVTDNMEKYELGIALDKINAFLWEEFCDWYIEMVKPRLFADDETTQAALYTLNTVLTTALKLLHPYMPFITEEIYKNLTDEDSIMISEWPVNNDNLIFKDEFEKVENIKLIIKNIRNLRAEMNIPNSKKCILFVKCKEKLKDTFLSAFFIKLAYGSEIKFVDGDIADESKYIPVVSNDSIVYMQLDELVDRDKEIGRLEDELKKLSSEIRRCEGMLSNKNFIDKAPSSKVEEEKEKLDKYKKQYEMVYTQLDKYKSR